MIDPSPLLRTGGDSPTPAAPTGVVLMTYGSPRNQADVEPYITRVRGGRTPAPDVVAEFERRYAAIGGSPLVAITRQQAADLEFTLNTAALIATRRPWASDDPWVAATMPGPYLVAAGMRFSAPSIADAVDGLVARGARRILGVALSPQYSPVLMGRYGEELEAAATQAGVPARMVGAWHRQPLFLEALAQRVRLGLLDFPPGVRDGVMVLTTAHSLPRRVVENDPAYVEQLRETAEAVAARAGLAPERWQFAYQSAGHTPEEWLKPDLLEILPQLAAIGCPGVLVAPIQFLADHLETLYDVDIAGRDQARQAGIARYARVPAPNHAPDFLEALAQVVRENVADWAPQAVPATNLVGAPA